MNNSEGLGLHHMHGMSVALRVVWAAGNMSKLIYNREHFRVM